MKEEKKKRNVSGSEVRRAYWLVGLDLGEPEHRAGMDGAQAPGEGGRGRMALWASDWGWVQAGTDSTDAY